MLVLLLVALFFQINCNLGVIVGRQSIWDEEKKIGGSTLSLYDLSMDPVNISTGGDVVWPREGEKKIDRVKAIAIDKERGVAYFTIEYFVDEIGKFSRQLLLSYKFKQAGGDYFTPYKVSQCTVAEKNETEKIVDLFFFQGLLIVKESKEGTLIVSFDPDNCKETQQVMMLDNGIEIKKNVKQGITPSGRYVFVDKHNSLLSVMDVPTGKISHYKKGWPDFYSVVQIGCLQENEFTVRHTNVELFHNAECTAQTTLSLNGNNSPKFGKWRIPAGTSTLGITLTAFYSAEERELVLQEGVHYEFLDGDVEYARVRFLDHRIFSKRPAQVIEVTANYLTKEEKCIIYTTIDPSHPSQYQVYEFLVSDGSTMLLQKGERKESIVFFNPVGDDLILTIDDQDPCHDERFACVWLYGFRIWDESDRPVKLKVDSHRVMEGDFEYDPQPFKIE